MPDTQDKQAETGPRPRYRWPWFLLAAVVLAILLAVVWMSREIDRTRRLRQWNPSAPSTNAAAARPPGR